MVRDKTALVVSNYWHRPGIKVTLRFDDETTKPVTSIHVEIQYADLVQAVLAQLPAPWKMLTRAQRDRAIKEAAEAVRLKFQESATAVL